MTFIIQQSSNILPHIALIGPVIESLVLLDRYIYLHETIPPSPTKQVGLVPLFDNIVSPRNMVVLAIK